MVSLFRAEWQKTVGHRWATGFLIWIFPVGAAAFVVLMGVLALISESMRDSLVWETPLWTTTMISAWTFPNNLFGRMFLIGYTAFVFGGEYQWGTWKNTVPRRKRAALIGVKFVVLATLVVTAFGLMSIVLGLGRWWHTAVAGVAYGPEMTTAVVGDFLRDYGLQAGLTFVSVLITAVIAALAAMIMRAILGGVMVGLGIAIVEPLTMALMVGVARWLDTASVLHVVRFTPTYNIENITSWVQWDMAFNLLETPFGWFEQTAPVDGVSFSLGVLLAWVVVGIGAILLLFQRQDITT